MAKKSPLICSWRAVLWFVINAAFALVPLLFLIVVRPSQKDDIATDLIHKLIEEGILMFACCALMGAVWFDIFLSNLKFRRFSNWAVDVSPFALVGIICFTYYQIVQGHIDHTVFNTLSILYGFVIPLTIFYCILGKYFLYRAED